MFAHATKEARKNEERWTGGAVAGRARPGW